MIIKDLMERNLNMTTYTPYIIIDETFTGNIKNVGLLVVFTITSLIIKPS
jgi:hypothetical protein